MLKVKTNIINEKTKEIIVINTETKEQYNIGTIKKEKECYAKCDRHGRPERIRSHYRTRYHLNIFEEKELGIRFCWEYSQTQFSNIKVAALLNASNDTNKFN
ncbi:MAG: hypothetical protein GX163_06765 [Bacteroidetes bacterium]|jgi:hypothetical protein|nr:hypothetical protein [Bacteroidota bacterium]